MEVQPGDSSVAYLMIHTFRWCRFRSSTASLQWLTAEPCLWTFHKYMCIWLECSHVAIWSYLGSSSWTERWPEGLSNSPCLAVSTGDHSCCLKGDWLKRQKASKVKAVRRGSVHPASGATGWAALASQFQLCPFDSLADSPQRSFWRHKQSDEPSGFWSVAIPGCKNCGHARRTPPFDFFHEAWVWATSSFSIRATHAEKLALSSKMAACGRLKPSPENAVEASFGCW